MGNVYHVRNFRSNAWKYGTPSRTWAVRLGVKRNKGRKDFTRGFQEEFKDVLEPSTESLGKRWERWRKEKQSESSKRPVPEGVRSFVDGILRKYEMHPDYDLLHKAALAAGVVGANRHKELDGQLRNYVEFSLYHVIKAGKPLPVGVLLDRFLELEGESATDRIQQARELEQQWEKELFGIDGAQDLNVEREVQKFKDYTEYLADRYAFSGIDIRELIEAGRYGAANAIAKFNILGDSPEYRGLVFSHINWYMHQAAGLTDEQKMQTPSLRELVKDYDEKKAYEMKLAEEEKERQYAIGGKRRSFDMFVRKFLNQREYKSIESKIEQAREDLTEDSNPMVIAANLLTENISRYKGKKPWDFRFGTNWPEELRRHTLEKLRYILEEERGIPVDQIPRVVDATLLYHDLGLKTFTIGAYKGRITNLVNDMYPGRFKPWEFIDSSGRIKAGRSGLWSRGGVELFNEATRWLVEEKLKIPVEEAPQKVNAGNYMEYGLGNALKRFFDGSPLHALASAYPDRLAPDDLIQAARKRFEVVVNNEILSGLIGRYEGFMWRYSARYFRGMGSKSKTQPLLRHLIDVDDLVQAGRKAIWDVIREHPEITLENAGRYHPLIARYITNQIRGTVTNMNKKNDVLSLSDSLDRLAYTQSKGNSTRTVEDGITGDDGRIDLVDGGSEDGDYVAFDETISDKQHEPLYPMLETLYQKIKRFKRFLRNTLYDNEFRSMEEPIEQYALQLENRYIWNAADFDPVEEGMKILKTVPRFEKIHKWDVKTHPWRGYRGHGGAQGGQIASVSERLKGFELAKEATHWLFEVKLRVPIDKIPQVTNTKLFNDNGLGGMLMSIYNMSAWAAVEDAYPGRWKPWEFKNTPHLWDKGELSYKIAAVATRWLIEEKLKTTPDRVRRVDFHSNRFGGMLEQLFHGNIRPALRNAYPEIYDPSKIEQVKSFLRQNLPFGLYSLMPERVIEKNVPKVEGWDPVDTGIKLMSRIYPEYGEKPIWQFRFNNLPTEKYSRTLVSRALKETMEKQGIKQDDARSIVTEQWIREQGLGEPVEALYGRLSESSLGILIDEVFRSGTYRKPKPSSHSQYAQERSEERLGQFVDRIFDNISFKGSYDSNDNTQPKKAPVLKREETDRTSYMPVPIELSPAEANYYRGFLNMLGFGRRIKIPYNGLKPEVMESVVVELAGKRGDRIMTEHTTEGLYVSIKS